MGTRSVSAHRTSPDCVGGVGMGAGALPSLGGGGFLPLGWSCGVHGWAVLPLRAVRTSLYAHLERPLILGQSLCRDSCAESRLWSRDKDDAGWPVMKLRKFR